MRAGVVAPRGDGFQRMALFQRNAFAGAHFARFELEETDVDVLELRVGFKF